MNCPFCGSLGIEVWENGRIKYDCGSCVGGDVYPGRPAIDYQTRRCRINQLEIEIARLRRVVRNERDFSWAHLTSAAARGMYDQETEQLCGGTK
jgi:hypothetical protein